ncbi:hypothetical protein J7E79_19970 [Bacillus sp. ISL-40]|nr:hypothetical protein [Bacillus sp. ISL-40]MBT2739646.1 hypothetical protein [Bacillus sp. ISL-77]
MPSKKYRWHCKYPASYLPKDSSTRLAGRFKRDSSVPIWRQPQHAFSEMKAHFGSFSFQTESGMSLSSRPLY